MLNIYFIYSSKDCFSKNFIKRVDDILDIRSDTPINKILGYVSHNSVEIGDNLLDKFKEDINISDACVVLWSKDCYENEYVNEELNILGKNIEDEVFLPYIINEADEELLYNGIVKDITDDRIKENYKTQISLRKRNHIYIDYNIEGWKEECNNKYIDDLLYRIINIIIKDIIYYYKIPYKYKPLLKTDNSPGYMNNYLNEILENEDGGVFFRNNDRIDNYQMYLKKGLTQTKNMFFSTLNHDWLKKVEKSNNIDYLELVNNYVGIIHSNNNGSGVRVVIGKEDNKYQEYSDIINYIKEFNSNLLFLYTNETSLKLKGISNIYDFAIMDESLIISADDKFIRIQFEHNRNEILTFYNKIKGKINYFLKHPDDNLFLKLNNYELNEI